MGHSRKVSAKRLKDMRDKSITRLSRTKALVYDQKTNTWKLGNDPAAFCDEALDRVQKVSTLPTTRPDGYSNNTRLGPRSGAVVAHTEDCTWQTADCDCGAAADKSSSTEATAFRLLEGGSQIDVQAKACERIERAFVTIWKELDAAEQAWDVILHAKDANNLVEVTPGVWEEFHHHNTTSVCAACLRDDVKNVADDRLKSGYCQACYKAWTRTDKGHGRADRNAFEATRRDSWVVNGINTADLAGYTTEEIAELQANGSLPKAVTA